MADKNTVGIIGVGLVGAALAERLLAADCNVIGFDIGPKRRDLLVRMGGLAAHDAGEVARRARCVLIALVEPALTVEIIESIAPVLEAGSTIVDTGTGDPARTVAMAARLHEPGIELIDAPLSGSSEQIRRGEAIAMLGGSASAIAGCAWLWNIIASRHVHMGPSGSGQRAKLATNLILGLNRAALAEGLAFAEAIGLDAGAFIELVRISPAYSRAVDAKAARMLARDYEPESRIAQHRKDVGLMLSAARDAGLSLPLSIAHAAQLDVAMAAGDGDRDSAAIVEVWRRSRIASTPSK